MKDTVAIDNEREGFSLSVSSRTVISSTVTEISIEQGESRNLLDLIVADEIRNRGKMEAMKKRRLVMDAESDKENSLRKCAKTLTSGNLMLSGHTQLTAAVKEKAKEMFEKKDVEKKLKEENKARRQASLDLTYNTAKNNLLWKKKLTRKDLTALLKEHHKKGDSPIKKKIEDVRKQWQKRSHRLVVMHNVAEPFAQIQQHSNIPSTSNIFLPGDLFNTTTTSTSTSNIFCLEQQQQPTIIRTSTGTDDIYINNNNHHEPPTSVLVQEKSIIRTSTGTDDIYINSNNHHEPPTSVLVQEMSIICTSTGTDDIYINNLNHHEPPTSVVVQEKSIICTSPGTERATEMN